MIEPILIDTQLTDKLNALVAGIDNAEPLMRIIAGDMADEVEENFEQQGRPQWLGLSPATLKNRARGKKGGGSAKILQDSGQLASSIQSRSDGDTAAVGTNKVYAAMMHFGGKKSEFPHLWGDIPGRPFLSIGESGEQKILSHTSDYLRGLVT